MKKKVIVTVIIIAILIFLKLLFNTIVNTVLINKYNNGEYSESQVKLLTFMNFPEGYVANYNYGNILYQNGEYESAIEKYKKALEGHVPKYKECNIRINYALSICKTVKVNEKDQESIKNAIQKYEEAINVLTEQGCANKNDKNGHSQKAEQLKEDIQKEIDRLKKLLDTENNKPSEENKNDNKKDSAEEIEQKMQDIKENATMEQRQTESQYEYMGKDWAFGEKNW